ncbi:hypothetical protein BCR33DRAFT_698844 [Rhizoclosmatium globosum]|uniref:Uncharacterized protein n=1 Tax=Rhizoclosmatium globosum TaxID=329046 RepID=A0A1Y2C6D7_9FUNG|nr:hypothetical protein BCR33DRAFT_698844 [Rhizoclosmatium globosum]|eukprot:ORY41845.1 hypothetical protein BCR33DRAFT_698844 [Rhizoclosmatium globosum]
MLSQSQPKKYKYTWAGWANQQAYVAGFFILCGGILTTVFYRKLPGNMLAIPVGVSTIVLGSLIMAIEHPISVLTKLGSVYTNYSYRIAFYSLIVGVSMLQTPTQTAGFCLICAIVTYARCVFCGEVCDV